MCEMFRHRPNLAAEILSGPIGLPLPDWREARLRSENVTDDRLAELRSDVVVEYWRMGRDFAVIVEVQLSDDRDKHFSWPETARLYLETTMKLKGYEYQSEALRKSYGDGKIEGKAEGAARVILRVLARRGVCVSAEVRDRITACTDLAQLDVWADRAAVVTTAQLLFDD